ncbi:MAG TPA: Gfo/Idh/MocA family oxidoreductase [Methylomirabilota bacterium]|nr:Gfo/Idh/MocA family oxidoreductase [Methylomirabilota bacterium]
MIRLAIVGCGAVARQYHLPALAQVTNVEVVALCDLNRQKAERLRRQFRMAAEVTEKLDVLAGRVDAAVVAVSPVQHAPVSIRLLEMGIDVCCEKPLATSSAEAERMIEAAMRHRRHLAVAQWCRFLPNLPLLRKLSLDGFVGRVHEITAEFGGPLDWPMESPAYFSRNSTAGGVFFDTGIHMLDALLWLFGDLSDIEYADDSLGGLEANAELRGSVMVSGTKVPVRLSFSWTDVRRNGLRVRGDAGSAFASPSTPEVVVLRRMGIGESLEMHVYRRGWNPAATTADAFRDQLKDFAEAVAERREPFVPATAAIHALRVIERAYAVRQPLRQPWVSPGLAP